jgi:hypothetical protein
MGALRGRRAFVRALQAGTDVTGALFVRHAAEVLLRLNLVVTWAGGHKVSAWVLAHVLGDPAGQLKQLLLRLAIPGVLDGLARHGLWCWLHPLWLLPALGGLGLGCNRPVDLLWKLIPCRGGEQHLGPELVVYRPLFVEDARLGVVGTIEPAAFRARIPTIRVTSNLVALYGISITVVIGYVVDLPPAFSADTYYTMCLLRSTQQSPRTPSGAKTRASSRGDRNDTHLLADIHLSRPMSHML